MKTELDTSEDERKARPSASSLHRLIACPASFLREKGLPDQGSEAAEKGTRIHRWLENREGELSEEELELAQACQNIELNLFVELGMTTVCAREERLWYKEDTLFGEELIFSGAADVVYSDATASHFLILDYKTGRGEVAKSDANYQLAALAVLLANKLGGGFERISCAIIQPLVSHKPLVVTYSAQDISEAEQFLLSAISEAEKKDAKAKPSDSACKYCKAFSSCPEARSCVQKATSYDIQPSSWETYTPEQKRECYDLAKLAKKFAELVSYRASADLEKGLPITGLELGKGRESFTIFDPSGAFSLLAEKLPKLKVEEFTKCCKVGITDLDKLVHDQLKNMGLSKNTKESKEWTRATLAECGDMRSTKGSIKEVEGLS